MTGAENCLYRTTVVHKRLRPVRHELRYRVFNIFIDVEQLDMLGLKWFSHNRLNIVAIHDRDHGKGDGSPIAPHLRGLLARHANGAAVARIFMFCYPRALGFVFNPLTIYYCYNSADCLVFIIYEVNNTFGDRKTYVVPVEDASLFGQSHAKQLFVSPFNAVEGRYAFHGKPPGEEIAIGVALRNSLGPCMKAYAAGKRLPLTDRDLLRLVASMPLMTFKVMAGIHWEALRLWLKGLRFKRRPPRPEPPYSIAKSANDK